MRTAIGAGDSNLTWELSPQLLYAGCDFELRFGYRELNYDFKQGGFQMDQWIHGPMIGFGLRF